MKGQTLGFVGFGKIARLTAEKLSGFQMHYLAHDPYLTPEAVRPWNVELVSLDELCRRSDYISMHAYYEEHDGACSARPSSAMKPTAYFVNPAGGTVDETAMIQALREGRIAGAALTCPSRSPCIRTT
jgi:D-3-phosphoglycerate dehydrogenase